MDIELFISPDHPALTGHFPGNPIVPAVVIIQAVVRRLGEVTGTRIDEVRQLRFQHPLLPGEPLTMSCEPRAPYAWRVTLKAGDTLIARGTFGQRTAPLPAPGTGPAGYRTRRNGAAAYRVLPHSGNMALIDTFETDDTGRVYTSIGHATGHPLEESGHLAPWVALEYAAQLYGCRTLLDVDGTSPADPMDRAFIVMVRSLQVNADWQPGGGRRAELGLQVVSAQGNAAQCEFDARSDGGIVSRGEFTVVSGR
ncbi:hypothetical protein [Marinobacter changyiensis]|uniref:hypothetical protein n=1 Tax=Marinobacter changyiensis TaxID=2604091 RepID=UPI0012648ED4|nr:hypothetical protein [Marinobacter changyiensis]